MTRPLNIDEIEARLRRELKQYGCPYPLGDERVHEWMRGYIRGTFNQPAPRVRIAPAPSWREIIYALAGAFAAGVVVWVVWS